MRVKSFRALQQAALVRNYIIYMDSARRIIAVGRQAMEELAKGALGQWSDENQS